jgi:hypothetical protein
MKTLNLKHQRNCSLDEAGSRAMPQLILSVKIADSRWSFQPANLRRWLVGISFDTLEVNPTMPKIPSILYSTKSHDKKVLASEMQPRRPEG